MNDRRGSALLIVLGFLSFMVVSAVAFSIYMRSERTPSAVFRRASVSRQLAHAALSRAIGELDGAIRADPFPGVHIYESAAMKNQANRYIDEWYGRVFMPPNPGTGLCSCRDHQNREYWEDECIFAPHDITAAVLTLEALGYVPAPLFNEARALGRLTWSAAWKPFDQGAGRYAYVALNVSDFIDVTRMNALSRSSGNRVNLVSLFSGENDPADGYAEANTFKDFVDRGRGGELTDWPFVSLLDMHLAMRGTVGGCISPFWNWIGENRTQPVFRSDADADAAVTQLFVTDSWHPLPPSEEAAGPGVIDLSRREPEYSASDRNLFGQPFSEDEMSNPLLPQEAIMRFLTRPFGYRTVAGTLPNDTPGSLNQNQDKMFLGFDILALYDYLDRDDIPSSLAFPCVERVPMTAAVSPVLNMGLRLDGTPGTPEVEEKIDGNIKTKTTTTYTDYKLTGNLAAGLKAGFVFPFRRGEALDQQFKARALMRIFLVEKNGGKDPGTLRQGNELASLRPQDRTEWQRNSCYTLQSVSGGGVPPPIVFTVVSQPLDVELPATGNGTQRDALSSSGTFVFDPITLPDGSMTDSDKTVFKKREEKIEKFRIEEGGIEVPIGTPQQSTYYRFEASPFDASGNRCFKASIADISAGWIDETTFDADYKNREFSPQVAVWIAVSKDGSVDSASSTTVDFVPALHDDDALYNNRQTAGDFDMAAFGGRIDGSNDGTPLMRFKPDGGTPFKYDVSSTPLISAGSWLPKSYCAVDPRYNWAPEDWWPHDSTLGANAASDWLTWLRSKQILGDNGRDTDIFMFVSNQGYLQSMGELAFLPAVSSFNVALTYDDLGSTDPRKNGSPECLLADSYGGAFHEHESDYSLGNAPNGNLFWRTYPSPEVTAIGNFYKDGSRSAAFRDFGVRGRQKINPYSDKMRILRMALANTPYDWWAASGTNTLANGSKVNPGDSTGARSGYFGSFNNNLDYTFQDKSGGEAEMSGGDIKSIASQIRSVFADSAANSDCYYWPFERIFDDRLAWMAPGSVADINDSGETQFKYFLGMELDNNRRLYGADRKFLHAFWKGCFGNRQQLFLVFVRAESGALGGSGEGNMPPQQGARAVALVWRDPETPKYRNKTPKQAVDLDRSGYLEFDSGADATPSCRRPHRTRILFFHQFD